MKLANIQAFFVKHKNKIILTLIGLVTAILMLSIGFFRTLLIVLLAGAGFLYGYMLDRFGFAGTNRVIRDFFKRLFTKQ